MVGKFQLNAFLHKSFCGLHAEVDPTFSAQATICPALCDCSGWLLPVASGFQALLYPAETSESTPCPTPVSAHRLASVLGGQERSQIPGVIGGYLMHVVGVLNYEIIPPALDPVF